MKSQEIGHCKIVKREGGGETENAGMEEQEGRNKNDICFKKQLPYYAVFLAEMVHTLMSKSEIS